MAESMTAAPPFRRYERERSEGVRAARAILNTVLGGLSLALLFVPFFLYFA